MKEKEIIDTKMLEKIKMVIINEEIMKKLDFDCGDEDLNDFIHNDALKHLYEDLAVTYLCVIDEIVLGFVSISNASIKISKKDKKEMEYKYPEFPSVRVGRLAIDKKYEGKGIGSYIIDWVFGKCEDMGYEVGIRFVSVDAYKDVVGFYKKNKFFIKDNTKKNIPMYFDLKKYKNEN